MGVGSGEGGGESAVFDPVVAEGIDAARGMCTLEWEGVGGPEEDGDNGSVTQSLVSLAFLSCVSGAFYLPMRSCRHELGNCVSERRRRVHMKHRERVFAFNQPAGGQNNRNEVRAGILKERQGRGPCEKLYKG